LPAFEKEGKKRMRRRHVVRDRSTINEINNPGRRAVTAYKKGA